MEAGLDNANNPFAVSNGGGGGGDTATDNIISQKGDGLLLNLTDNFKQNGTDLSPTADFYRKEKPNGKRLASDFDEDDDDFGPETNVDAVDDVLSPVETARGFGDIFTNNNPAEGVYNPFVEHQEKAALEIERELQKQQSGEFEERRLAREETPTPPADAVHDVSGLVDNAAESDSEDEWNYIKGDDANKENISPQPDKEVAEVPEEDDTMSQLNPNAAEFVPVSPTRSIPSPACRALLNDQVISQSPRRPTANDIDINVPNPVDFEKEVKSRPSDVDSYSNGHDETSPNRTSTDLMEALLNGKNIDEIPEFQPVSTPNKLPPSEEFHFGPNAAPFTPSKLLDQSEAAVSTTAVYGDESTATLGTSFNESVTSQDTAADLNLLNKESDPMSMSFYADKDDGNPFDLNQVHVLPDNIDDFLNKPDTSTFDETISDLPEHHPLGEKEDLTLNNDDAIQTTDLDKGAYYDEKELASPLEPEKELLEPEECDLPKTPEPTHENLLNEFCRLPEKSETPENLPRDVELISPVPRPESTSSRPESYHDELSESKSPLPEATEVADLLSRPEESMPRDVELISPDLGTSRPDSTHEEVSESPQLSKSPALQASEIDDLLQSKSPLPEVNVVPDAKSPVPEALETEDLLNAGSDVSSKSPLPDVCELPQAKSPTSDILESSELPESRSPVCELPVAKSPVCELGSAKSPVYLPSSESPVCERPSSLSPVCDLGGAKSPTDEIEGVCELGGTKSPVCEFGGAKSPVCEFGGAKSPVCEFGGAKSPVCEFGGAKSPVCEFGGAKSPIGDIEGVCELGGAKSPVCEFEGVKSPVCELEGAKSPVCELEGAKSPVCELEGAKSPVCELEGAKSPVCGLEGAKSPVCELEGAKSPVCELEGAKSPVCEISIAKSPIHLEIQPESCDFSAPKSPVATPDFTKEEELVKADVHFEDLCKSEENLLPTQADHTTPEVIELAQEKFEEIFKPKEAVSPVDSPQEDITTSVKDEVPSPVECPILNQIIEDSFVADQSSGDSGLVEELADAIKETVVEAIPEALETCSISTSKPAEDTESVATADMNSFLERSLPPDVASPLSPNEQPPPMSLDHPLMKCVYPLPTQLGEHIDVKTENISPEFAEQAIVTPSEESKQEEVPTAPLVEEPVKEPVVEEKTGEVAAGAAAATAAVVGTVAAVAAVKAETPKDEKKKVGSPAKKPAAAAKAAPKAATTRTSTTSKSTASRLSASPKASPAKTSTAKPPTTASVPRPATTRPSPRPKPTSAPTPKSTEKKPLANGDVKSTVRSTLVSKKTVSETTTAKSASARPASGGTARLSPTKPPASKPAAPRPTTAPTSRATTTRTTPTSLNAVPKPRPTSLASKTTTTTTGSAAAKSATATKSPPTKVSPRTTTAPRPKPPITTTSTLSKPRVPLTKTITKAADTEKQNKESANKLTAARSVTSSTTTRTTSTAAARTTSTMTFRKVESKVAATTRTSKTTTTTMKSTTGKKPTEIVRHATKTKTTKVEKPKENGVTTVVTEEITKLSDATNGVIDGGEPQLLKDNSPVDNKLIENTLIEPNAAD